MAETTSLLTGCFRILFHYDVAEGLDLTKVRKLLGLAEALEARGFPRRTPEYIRFEHAPVIERSGPFTLKSGEQFACSIKYYSFAVVAIEVQVPFTCDWHELVAQSSRWMDAGDIEPTAREIIEQHLSRVAPAVVRLNKLWLQEGYLVISLQHISQAADQRPTAAEIISAHGNEIVQLVRGETLPLDPKTVEETLQARLSYYPSDLVVIGPSAAFVYDRAEDAAATTQVLAFAKMQLLEFRYYDNWMSTLLEEVYSMLERKRNTLLSRWSLPRDAQRVNAIRLDVMELTERIDNAIKFVSDTYYARVYRLAANRIGLPDYRNLVDQKLRTAGELYGFMVDQFNEARSFVLEAGIVILMLLDVILLVVLLKE